MLAAPALAQQPAPSSPAARAAAQVKEQRDAITNAAEAARRAAKAAEAAEAAAREAARAAEVARKAQIEAEEAARQAAGSAPPPSTPAPPVAATPRPGAAASPLRPGPPNQPTTIRVGPGQKIRLPSEAARIAFHGDTVEIEAGVYAGDVAVWTQNDLTLRGVGGKAHLKAEGKSAEGKAIWVIRGHRAVVENIEFSECRVSDRNGAGIRLEGAGLTVRHSFFHDNENGILTGANRDSDVVVEWSEFARNGHGDGQSHNLYIGGVRSFTLRGSYVHRARIGHNVKSRAATNYILYNRILDGPDGTASYTVEFPAGGDAYVLGNLLHQGPQTDNSVIVSYGAEMPSGAQGGDLYLVNNTLVNDRPQGGVFLQRRPSGKTVLINNIFAGPGEIQAQVETNKGNLVTSTPDAGFVDAAKLDYHLRGGSPAIGKGIDPGNAGALKLRPDFEYLHPANAKPRRAAGALDAGAFEYTR